MEIAKAIGLTNVGVWVWATWRLLVVKDAKPFSRLLALSIAVDFLKRGFREPRPLGAKACDALGIGGAARTFGMPSGHVATAVAGWVLVAQALQASHTTQVAVAVVAAVLMSWARVRAGCHTLLQSLMGALFGWIAVQA